MKWVSVKERLPKTMENVLVYAPNYDNYGDKIQSSYITFDDKWFMTSGFCCTKDQYFGTQQITHWMPLPEPPCDDPRQLENTITGEIKWCCDRHKMMHDGLI